MLKGAFIMKITEKDMIVKAQKAIRSCLEDVPFVRILSVEQEPRWDMGRPDLIVNIEISGTELLLVIETKSSGQPRIARDAVNQILRYVNRRLNCYGIFAAPFVSKQSSEICKEGGIGYLDLAGNCYLSFGSIHIEREGKPNLYKRKNYLRSLYYPKAERILRVLLTNPNREWKIQELAKESNTSIGQVANVKKLLADHEWINTKYGRLSLSDPETLLSEWSTKYNFKRNTLKHYYSLKKVPDIEYDLSDYCKYKNIKYAFTAFSGAARYSPYVKYQRVMAYIQESELDFEHALNLKTVQSGANLTLIIPYDEGVFYKSKEIDNCFVAAPIQIFLDLINMKNRGEEAADFLFEQVIKSTW